MKKKDGYDAYSYSSLGTESTLPLGTLDDGSHITRSSRLQFLFIEQPRFSSGISHEHSALLGGLHVGFEVASDSIANSHVGKVARIKEVTMLSSQLKQFIGKPIVVLLLLDRVVESRVAEVLLAVRNQETFQLSRQIKRVRT